MGPLAHLNIAVGNVYAAASPQILAQAANRGNGRGGSTTPAEASAVGNDIRGFIEANPNFEKGLRGIGIVLLVAMVSWYVIKKATPGQGAGGQGAKLGQVAGGLLGLGLLFSPPLMADGGEWVMTIFVSLFSWVGDFVFG